MKWKSIEQSEGMAINTDVRNVVSTKDAASYEKHGLPEVKCCI